MLLPLHSPITRWMPKQGLSKSLKPLYFAWSLGMPQSSTPAHHSDRGGLKEIKHYKINELWINQRVIKNAQKRLLKAAQKHDIRATAQLLSFAEDHLSEAIDFLSAESGNSKHVPALRIGITGPPGAGKSSLLNLVIKILRSKKLRVAVLAVDPSSPFSGGALLGDRVRMNQHAEDPEVFIRSLGSRGGFGGLSVATGAMAKIFELCGYDIILIETVGVGQTELEIMNLADATAVVLVPESGDVIQTLKAGILEIADCFVVNKADRPGAEALAAELHSLVEQEGDPHDSSRRSREIFLTSVLENRGIENLVDSLLKMAPENQKNIARLKRRALGELRHLLLHKFEEKIAKKIKNLKFTDAYSAYRKIK